MKETKIAFFDLDGTIIGTWFYVLFIQHQYLNGRVSQADFDEVYELKRVYQANRYNTIHFRKYSDRLVEIFTKSLNGLTIDEVNEISLQVAQDSTHKKYIFVSNLLQELKSLNYKLVAISGSIDFMVQAFCKIYGFDAGYGHGYKVSSDWQYNFCEPVTWANKHKIVRQAIKDNNWKNITQIVAVGDTSGDVGLFLEADVCIAINPSDDLVLSIDHIFKASNQDKQFYVVMEAKDSVLLLEYIDITTEPKLANPRFLNIEETGIF